MVGFALGEVHILKDVLQELFVEAANMQNVQVGIFVRMARCLQFLVAGFLGAEKEAVQRICPLLHYFFS